MRSLLVTGGAGFIGANFVHYWLRQHPGDRVVVLDALTYAGNRANLASVEGEPALRFVKGDICDAQLVAALLREERIDWVVHFAAESHVDARSSLPMPSFAPTCSAPTVCSDDSRCAWAGQLSTGVSLSPCLHRRGLRLAHCAMPGVHRKHGIRAQLPYSASKAGSDHLVRAYHNLRAAGNHQQLLEQLRALSVSREADSADDGVRARRQTDARVRPWRERARLAVRGGPLPGHRCNPGKRPCWRDLQRGRSQRVAKYRRGSFAMRDTPAVFRFGPYAA